MLSLPRFCTRSLIVGLTLAASTLVFAAPTTASSRSTVVERVGDYTARFFSEAAVPIARIVEYHGTDTDLVIPETITYQGVAHSVYWIGEDSPTGVFESLGLTSVTLPSTVVVIAPRAFENNLLTSVELPVTVSSIGNRAFRDNNLTQVHIPQEAPAPGTKEKVIRASAGRTTDNIVIGNSAFADNQIAALTLSPRISWISTRAFEGHRLSQIRIPRGIGQIDSHAFASPTLEHVDFDGYAPGGSQPFGYPDQTNVTVSFNGQYHERHRTNGFTTPTWAGHASRVKSLGTITFDWFKQLPRNRFRNGDRISMTLPTTMPAIGVDRAVQWLRDGKAIRSATSTSYRATPADVGHRLSVRVTASSPYATSAVWTSDHIGPVLDKATTFKVKAPKTAIKRSTITVSASGMRPGEKYRLSVGGQFVLTGQANTSGRMKKTFTLPATADAGKRTIVIKGSQSDRKGSRPIKLSRAKR